MMNFSMKKKIILILVILIVGLSYILVTNFRDSATYYITVEEFIDLSPDETRQIRLAGILDPDSINYNEFEGIYTFQVKDKDFNYKIDCIFNGIIPSNLASQEEVLLEGKMQENFFKVNQIMFQCPSRYEESL